MHGNHSICSKLHGVFLCIVTEEEIFHGVLEAKNTSSTCHWFRRIISDIEDNLEAKAARRFIDMSGGKLDREALGLLGNLR